jgi:enoyl-CoA hydratase/3-hydroxyacyl-CoA dehydrogenase
MYDPRIVAVIGAGNMGAGIAQKIAQEGYEVRLADMDLERAQAGYRRVEESLEQAVARRILRAEAAEAVLARITPVGSLEELSDVDLVIEAVFENLAVKKELFGKLDSICKPATVLATNTSSFFVKDLSDHVSRPELVVGLHYFFHPAKNRLLEVIPGPETKPEVIAAMLRFAEGHGKTGLITADAAGFCVNRFFVPWLNGAVRLLAEGIADIPSIEAATKSAFGIGMGPFELMNLTGIPVALHAAATLGRELGGFYVPSPRLAAQVESGELWPLDGEADPSVAATVADRLLGVTFAVSTALVDQRVCSREDVDRGARIGLRWARGPFELMNETGLAESLRMVEQLGTHHPDEQVPASLAAQGAKNEPWTFRRVDLAVQDGVATITINRPEVLNALDEEVIAQLSERFGEAWATEGLKAIILAGAGKAFIAGADISFFVRNIEAGDFERIQRFTEAGQRLLNRIGASPVPVIARVQGLALGGGVEVALACHAIVCSHKASFGLPETGIGIYPGLGGTQRLPRIVGRPLARRMIFTGRPLRAREAVSAGLALEAVPIQELDSAIARWIEQGVPDRYAQALVASTVNEAYADNFVETVLAGQVPRGLPTDASELLEKDLRAISRKAPLALRTAAQLLREGAELELDEALILELRGLEAIFKIADALLGLRSVGGRETPAWQGC